MDHRSSTAICVTVTGTTTAELRRRRDAVVDGDLVELRLDTVRDPDVDACLADRSKPVVVTCRARWEGGHFDGPEEERIRLLDRAWQRGAEFVDLESRAPSAAEFLARTGGRRVVLSFHDFERVPPDLDRRFQELARTSAEVVKLAVTASRVSDCVPLFALGAQAGDRSRVLLAMGPAGSPTRLLAHRIGSRWSYAGDGWVPGHIPAARLVEEFRFGLTSPRAAVYAVVGNPIMHSLSPAMHNAAFRESGVDAVYIPLEAADAADFFALADALDIQGASVTAPFKLAVASSASLDERARVVGAVNTLRRGPHGWEATNTDVDGFLAPLADRLHLKNVRAAVLGGGGAARAVAIALDSHGAVVTIHARRSEQGEEVARAAGVTHAPWPPAPGTWDLLVNATPVGTAPRDETPLPNADFDGRVVYDLVYNPPQTRLLREAATAGCETIGGLDMLVAQAQHQFEWWTGIRPDGDVMRRAAIRRLMSERGAHAAAPPDSGVPVHPNT